MKVINVEVIGVDPPCPRCKATEENSKKAAKKLEEEGVKVNVVKLNISAPETVSKYGILMSPAIAVNGKVKIMGKVPDPGVVERILREEL
ncbi:MAG: thioredoxin family protein [Candidatus Bathyarchaeia archaeon]